jgi:hypothetical protein
MKLSLTYLYSHPISDVDPHLTDILPGPCLWWSGSTTIKSSAEDDDQSTGKT